MDIAKRTENEDKISRNKTKIKVLPMVTLIEAWGLLGRMFIPATCQLLKETINNLFSIPGDVVLTLTEDTSNGDVSRCASSSENDHSPTILAPGVIVSTEQ